jgi:hypothetical protein
MPVSLGRIAVEFLQSNGAAFFATLFPCNQKPINDNPATLHWEKHSASVPENKNAALPAPDIQRWAFISSAWLYNPARSNAQTPVYSPL